jgi:hypothetical protein
MIIFVLANNLNTLSKDWLTLNQNNVSKWSDMFTRGLLFQ